jgi:hypothetical protein
MALYSLRPGDDGYNTQYTRLRREVGDLEARGFVSRRLLGRDRPYRLTQLAVAKLTKIVTVRKDWGTSIMPKVDVILNVSTLVFLMATVSVSEDFIQLPEVFPFILLYSLALVFTGMSLARFAQMMMKVI